MGRSELITRLRDCDLLHEAEDPEVRIYHDSDGFDFEVIQSEDNGIIYLMEK